MNEHAPPSLPSDLVEAAARRNVPLDLLQRAIEKRMAPSTLRHWLGMEWINAEYIERRLYWHEQLTFGPLRGREATRKDNEALSELLANAPEEIGDWELYTERGPNAFAQFRLQENVNVLVLEEAGRLIACCSFTTRKTIVGGKRLTVRYGQLLRVHRDLRRRGYGDQVRSLSWGAGAARPSHCQYDIMRPHNFAVVGWWSKYAPNFWDNIPKQEGEVPGLRVTVLQYPPRPFNGNAAGIRKAREEDLDRCVELINRTHGGLDLFRPYSSESLRNRLDDGYWGQDMRWFDGRWDHVYGWDDYYVLEQQGQLVACAGLWDRGRDARDRYRHKESREERLVAVASLLDFGFAAGHEASMARLIAYLVGETQRLGRDFLVAPLEQLPAVAAHLEQFDPVPDTRALRWELPDPPITRAHIDLAYW
jgi:N-acetylglutamate synthase-like GNAT family acetyltransferase